MQPVDTKTSVTVTETLSVSSVGSEAMQRSAGRQSFLAPSPTFQYPRSDRRRCNDPVGGWRAPNCYAFQYPRSDRRRCNADEAQKAIHLGDLSVSSVGSEAMQHWSAWSRRIRSSSFQYPRSDRRRCNHPGQKRQHGNVGHFQYPRSDRRRCNERRNHHQPRSARPFQYPRSDRRRCNLQLELPRATFEALSVSSVGSEAMQHRPGDFRIAPSECFQYPRSDRRRCNVWLAKMISDWL